MLLTDSQRQAFSTKTRAPVTVPLPAGWEKRLDKTGKHYYFVNALTKQKQTEDPRLAYGPIWTGERKFALLALKRLFPTHAEMRIREALLANDFNDALAANELWSDVEYDEILDRPRELRSLSTTESVSSKQAGETSSDSACTLVPRSTINQRDTSRKETSGKGSRLKKNEASAKPPSSAAPQESLPNSKRKSNSRESGKSKERSSTPTAAIANASPRTAPLSEDNLNSGYCTTCNLPFCPNEPSGANGAIAGESVQLPFLELSDQRPPRWSSLARGPDKSLCRGPNPELPKGPSQKCAGTLWQPD